MRRFFISNLERLLNILTVLAGFALLAWAIVLGLRAQGDPVQLLMAAAILLGGLVAIVALAGCAALALSIHDHTRRIAALIERPGAVTPLRANRKPEAPRPAQAVKTTPVQPSAPALEPAAPRDRVAPAPMPHPAPTVDRPVFSGMAMSKTAPTQPKPAAPAPSHNPLSSAAPRLVAERRIPR